MPTAQTTSANRAKTGVKPAGTRSATTRRPGSAARKTGKGEATSARARRAPGRPAAEGPSLDGTHASGRGVDRSTGALAERAILIPVGAALIARERVLASVNDTIANYSSSSRTQAQLRRFERRGATARNRLEREVRKTRVRVERELRQRRRGIEKTVEERRGTVTRNRADLASRVPELANRVQERILKLV